MTNLIPTIVSNKGEVKKYGNAIYTFCNFEILPNPEPDEFEDKLIKLLMVLEQDIVGVKRLVENANGHIQVEMEMHNGNGMIGGPNIEFKNIQRINDLGLSINFDLYVGGNSFID